MREAISTLNDPWIRRKSLGSSSSSRATRHTSRVSTARNLLSLRQGHIHCNHPRRTFEIQVAVVEGPSQQALAKYSQDLLPSQSQAARHLRNAAPCGGLPCPSHELGRGTIRSDLLPDSPLPWMLAGGQSPERQSQDGLSMETSKMRDLQSLAVTYSVMDTPTNRQHGLENEKPQPTGQATSDEMKSSTGWYAADS